MAKTLIAFTLAILFAGKVIACLNGETLALKDGSLLYEDHEGNVPRGHLRFPGIYDVALI